MNKDQPNDAGDYFERESIFSSTGLSKQVSEDDPLEATRRLMPAFMEAKYARRTKLGYPLTITNRKAYADLISPAALSEAIIVERVVDVARPTKLVPKPPERVFALIRTQGDRAKWVEVIENAAKE